MSAQPEALRLAEKMESYKLCSGYAWHCHKAAAELRRLHEVLQSVANFAHSGGLAGMSESDALIAIRRATLMEFNRAGSHDQRRAAIAKAEGKAEGEMK